MERRHRGGMLGRKWCRMKCILMVSIKKAGFFEVLLWCQCVMGKLIKSTGQETGSSSEHSWLLGEVSTPRRDCVLKSFSKSRSRLPNCQHFTLRTFSNGPPAELKHRRYGNTVPEAPPLQPARSQTQSWNIQGDLDNFLRCT